ncbi:MAG: hypothetical protein GX444_19875 [Myxococcales bacterium]|nr:hypothetical protein [Myxococcales bacterium]
MEMVEMIRCSLSKDPKKSGETRYVPAEIFQMWRFLMERVHQMHIKDPRLSMWVAEEFYAPTHDKEPAEAVIEIRFRYLDIGEVGRIVTRYFPESEFDFIFEKFRKHFPDQTRMEEMTRRRGFYLSGASAKALIAKGG